MNNAVNRICEQAKELARSDVADWKVSRPGTVLMPRTIKSILGALGVSDHTRAEATRIGKAYRLVFKHARIAAIRAQEEEVLKYGPLPDPRLVRLLKDATPRNQGVQSKRALKLWKKIVKPLAEEMVGGYPPNDMANLRALIKEFDRFVKGIGR